MDNQQIEASKKYKAYLLASRKFFEKHSAGMVVENHYNHNLEPNFWKYMVQPVISTHEPNIDSLALEFGCGAGRNLLSLLVAGNFQRVDGIDISKGNAINAQKFVESKIGFGRSICIEGNGYTCLPFPSDTYTFVISHQVFIHIPNREIRLSILKDLFRILKVRGTVVIHFKEMGSSVEYSDNYNNFPMNVTVTEEDFPLIISDFEAAGFTNIDLNPELNWVDEKMELFVTARKVNFSA